MTPRTVSKITTGSVQEVARHRFMSVPSSSALSPLIRTEVPITGGLSGSMQV